MNKEHNFTEGKIIAPLLRFMLPVLAALFLQAMYGAVMFYLAFFHGGALSGIFSKDAEVIAASADYLKAYAIDCLLTCFLFCLVGYYNGCGNTFLVMAQGIIGAFCVRIPVAFLMRSVKPVSLFHIGLATPCSTFVQIIICITALVILQRRQKKKDTAV